MRSRILAPLAVAATAALTLTACAGGAAPAGTGEPVTDGTFTMALYADPGNLNPLLTAGSPTHALAQLSYDFLVYVDPTTTEVSPWLAESWEEASSSVSFTLRDDVVCSDGTPLTAQTVADNITFVTTEDNKSALRGVYVPATASATADGNTVTVTTPAASPFLLLNLSRLPILCDAALTDPESATKATVGSGMYELTASVANDSYTYTRRDDYAWGPNDATAADEGTPKSVEVKVITNESTAANQLLSGEINAAVIAGADQERLDASGFAAAESRAIAGEMYFNHGADRPTADVAVRTALVQAVNLQDLSAVITGGRGTPSTSLVSTDPRACVDDTVTGNLPAYDPKAAAKTLEGAGWAKNADGVYAKDGQTLSLKFFYDSMGDTYDAAADVALQAWTELGADIEVASGDSNKSVEVLLSGTDNSGWDISWEPLYVNLPSMLVPFFSGPAPAEGLNFPQVSNPEYDAAVAAATELVGDEACAAWADAEKALFAQSSVIPFADSIKKTYFNGAELAFGTKVSGPALRVTK